MIEKGLKMMPLNPENELVFCSIGGLDQVYQPSSAVVKKHPCPDCHHCQGCSDVRCQACRRSGSNPGPPAKGKLSMEGQIRLFERINKRSKVTDQNCKP